MLLSGAAVALCFSCFFSRLFGLVPVAHVICTRCRLGDLARFLRTIGSAWSWVHSLARATRCAPGAAAQFVHAVVLPYYLVRYLTPFSYGRQINTPSPSENWDTV